MSGEDLTSSRVRRMLPSVSEVLKELTARAPIEPEIAFRAAREVCAEELKRIRDAGGDSVPLEDLVQRAFLLATGAALSEAPPPPSPPFVPPPPPVPEPAEVADAPTPDGSREAEDPFSETTGAMDLRWDRDGREPFSETPVPGGLAGSEREGEAEPIEEAARGPSPVRDGTESGGTGVPGPVRSSRRRRSRRSQDRNRSRSRNPSRSARRDSLRSSTRRRVRGTRRSRACRGKPRRWTSTPSSRRTRRPPPYRSPSRGRTEKSSGLPRALDPGPSRSRSKTTRTPS